MQRATLRRSQLVRADQNPQCSETSTPGFGSPCNSFQSVCPADGHSNRPQTCCSNEYFILAAACQTCTGQENLSWSQYQTQHRCEANPFAIPSDAPLPTPTMPFWVFQMAQATPIPDVFNLRAALDFINGNNGTSTSSTTGANSTSTSSTPTSASVSSTPPISQSTSETDAVPTQSSADPSPASFASSGSSTNVGAIVGGVIGAVLVLALAALGIWYAGRRRRRSHVAPSAAYKAALRSANPTPMPGPYHPVYHDSPQSSTEDLPVSRPASWLPSPSRPVSIHSESRFHEHTTA